MPERSARGTDSSGTLHERRGAGDCALSHAEGKVERSVPVTCEHLPGGGHCAPDGA